VRLGDPQHPFVHADHWTPFALLFLQRLFAGGTWRDAGLLAGAVALQLLASAYNVIEFGLVASIAVAALLVHHRRRLAPLVPKLAAVAVATAVAAGLVFGPFARARALWPSHGHFSVPLPLAGLLRGGDVYPGTIAVVLAAVAILDRLRRRAGRDDLRYPMLAAGLLCGWLAIGGLRLPGVGFVPSPLFYYLARGRLPALEGLRGLHNIAQGVPLAATFLAGWGMAVVTRALPRPAAVVAVALAVVGAGAEVFHPDLARASFGRPLDMNTVAARPPAEERALLARLAVGPVLDLPYLPGNLATWFAYVPHYATFRMFHQHRIAACPASLGGPAEPDVGALAARLPDARAADALYAIGFRNVVIHEEYLSPRERSAWWIGLGSTRAGGPRLVPIGRAHTHATFALRSPEAVTTSFDALAAGPPAPPLRVTIVAPQIAFTLRNRAPTTYRHPDPLEPTLVRVSWHPRAGGRAVDRDVPLLLPLALASGEQIERTVTTSLPPPGRYKVTLALAGRRGALLGRRAVDVAPLVPRPPGG
jgi:hypothetical protein